MRPEHQPHFEFNNRNQTDGVGASHRTPFKHWLLDGLLAKTACAAACMSRIKDFNIVDCCAGDGHPNAFSGFSSPQIVARYVQHASELAIKRSRDFRVRAFLIEREPHICTILRTNIDHPLCKVVNGSYLSPNVIEQFACNRFDAACFLNIDPNHVNELQFPHALQNVLPKLTTFLTSLGCNAGGLKRLSFEHREKWYVVLQNLRSIMLRTHDGALVRLEKDDAQWAYFFTIPYQWRKDAIQIIRRVQRQHWAKGVEHYWISDQEGLFWDMADRLFLRESERQIASL
jgi:hypothetical protein